MAIHGEKPGIVTQQRILRRNALGERPTWRLNKALNVPREREADVKADFGYGPIGNREQMLRSFESKARVKLFGRFAEYVSKGTQEMPLGKAGFWRNPQASPPRCR